MPLIVARHVVDETDIPIERIDDTTDIADLQSGTAVCISLPQDQERS